MAKTKLISQPEKGNPIWQDLLSKLNETFKGELKIVFPTEWNNFYFSWFHKMEEAGFRKELQYSFNDMERNFENPGMIFWFITVNDDPQILLFGYSIPDSPIKSFYLDTFAVKRRGEGIGNIVMEFLIRWAKTKQYKTIVLDTEIIDEKGIPLQKFYSRHGFEIISLSEKGELVMRRSL